MSIPTTTDFPSSRREKKRRRVEEPTDNPPNRLFIGRTCCSPFVFALGEGITATNREWLRSGSINEMDYEEEARTPGESESSTSSKRARSPSYSEMSDGWSRRQEVFLWKAQLRYGEGKEWDKVVKIVNKADPDSKPHTLWECQAKWAEVRRETRAL